VSDSTPFTNSLLMTYVLDPVRPVKIAFGFHLLERRDGGSACEIVPARQITRRRKADARAQAAASIASRNAAHSCRHAGFARLCPPSTIGRSLDGVFISGPVKIR
jgi:hypothetical protein